jgi:hypothetical protein
VQPACDIDNKRLPADALYGLLAAVTLRRMIWNLTKDALNRIRFFCRYIFVISASMDLQKSVVNY